MNSLEMAVKTQSFDLTSGMPKSNPGVTNQEIREKRWKVHKSSLEIMESLENRNCSNTRGQHELRLVG